MAAEVRRGEEKVRGASPNPAGRECETSARGFGLFCRISYSSALRFCNTHVHRPKDIISVFRTKMRRCTHTGNIPSRLICML